MKYKILCSDLDGTLLTTKNDVSEFTISEINRIKNHIKIILVSARMPKSMVYLQERMGITHQPIICYNGALILNGEKEILSITMPNDEVETLYSFSEAHQIKLGLYHKDYWYVPEDSERVQKEIFHTKARPIFEDSATTLKNWNTNNIGVHKIMMMGTKESIDTIWPKLSSFNKLQFYRSNDTLIEVAPKEISKLSAIKKLLNYKESLEDVIAFGDNYNDLEMLAHVGCGVAIGNARDEVKAIANYITLKNTENGVANFIKHHLVF